MTDAHQGSFLDKVDKFVSELEASKLGAQSTIDLSRIYADYQNGFNTKRLALHVSAARLQEMFNLMKKEQARLAHPDVKLFLSCLYPFASTLSSELYFNLYREPLHDKILAGGDLPASGSDDCYKLLVNSRPKGKVDGLAIERDAAAALKGIIEDASKIKKVIVNHERKVVNVLLH